MKLYPLLLFLLTFAVSANSQIYKTNIGVRIDESQFGVSLDQKVYKQFSVQAAFDARSNEVRSTAFVRYHKKILGRRFNIYPAIGAHVGNLKEYGNFSGFDLLLGTEYKLILLPVVVSFDVNPAFHTSGTHSDWWDFQTVFSVKYILIKDKNKLFEKWRNAEED